MDRDPTPPRRRSANSERQRTLRALKSVFGTRVDVPAAADASASPVETGATVRPGLVLEQQVGAGGLASVHAAFDRGLLRRVALKRLHPSAEREEEDEVRLMDEAQIMARLDHPNVVSVHEVGVMPDGELFFTMKLVEGEDLATVLGRKPPEMRSERDFVEALKVLIKVCDALSFAHSRGVVHRDLKPDNVMVGSHGQVYVVDWGVALTLAAPGAIASADSKAGEGLIDALGTVIGTPGYMAPEQARGETLEIDARTDVYGVGGILYAVLTGFPPHCGETQEETVESAITGTVFDPEDMNPDVLMPPMLTRITMRALAAEKADRYASMDELKDDLERFLLGGGSFPERLFEPGETIVHEGEGATSAYLIASGTCEVFKVATGAVVLREMGAREVFGEASLFSPGGKRTASVRAATRVRVMEITRDALLGELESGFWVGPLVRSIVDRFLALDEDLSVMGRELAGQRLLLDVYRCFAMHGTQEGGVVSMAVGALAERVAASSGVGFERVLELVAEDPGFELAGDQVRLVADPN